MASEEEKRPFLQRPMPRILVFGGSSLVLLLGLSLALLKIVFGNVPLTKIIDVLLNGAQLNAQDSPVRVKGGSIDALSYARWTPSGPGYMVANVRNPQNLHFDQTYDQNGNADLPSITVPANTGWLITFNDCAARGCQSEDDDPQHNDFALELCSNSACALNQRADGSVYLRMQHGAMNPQEEGRLMNYYDRKQQCASGGTDTGTGNCNKIMHFFVIVYPQTLAAAPAHTCGANQSGKCTIGIGDPPQINLSDFSRKVRALKALRK